MKRFSHCAGCKVHRNQRSTGFVAGGRVSILGSSQGLAGWPWACHSPSAPLPLHLWNKGSSVCFTGPPGEGKINEAKFAKCVELQEMKGSKKHKVAAPAPLPLPHALTTTPLAFGRWSKASILQEKATDPQGELWVGASEKCTLGLSSVLSVRPFGGWSQIFCLFRIDWYLLMALRTTRDNNEMDILGIGPVSGKSTF